MLVLVIVLQYVVTVHVQVMKITTHVQKIVTLLAYVILDLFLIV